MKYYIYGLLNEHKQVIYVGMTVDINRRIRNHKYRIKTKVRNKPLYDELERVYGCSEIDYLILSEFEGSKQDAKVLESSFIQQYECSFNVYKLTGADSKEYKHKQNIKRSRECRKDPEYREYHRNYNRLWMRKYRKNIKVKIL